MTKEEIEESLNNNVICIGKKFNGTGLILFREKGKIYKIYDDGYFATDNIRTIGKRHEITEDELQRILQKEDLKERYMDIIAGSPGVDYLPPWQKTLTFVLLDKDNSIAEIVDRINNEMWHRPHNLRIPPQEKSRGQIIHYDIDSGRGVIVTLQTRFVYYFIKENLESSFTSEELLDAAQNRKLVVFTLRRSKGYFEVVDFQIES